MNPLEFILVIELTETVQSHLKHIANSKLGTKFFIKSNGDVGKLSSEEQDEKICIKKTG